MQQYHAAKQEYPECLLFFRLGDFFELFYEDAVVAARDLQIALTSRSKEKGEPVPMCGVPARTIDSYLAKLLEKGHRVAICDQVEDARKAKGLVKRAIVRVLSPGTTSDPGLLKSGENNYLAAVRKSNGHSGLAYLDVSTGEFRMTEMASEQVEETLCTLNVKEVLIPSAGPLFGPPAGHTGNGPGYLNTELDSWIFDFEYAERVLKDFYGLHSLDGLGAAGRRNAVSAAGALVHYLKDTQRSALQHLERPGYFEQKDWMVLDSVTIRHLELVAPLFDGSKKATLLHVLDRTATPMGARLLRKWVLQPSIRQAEIEQRHEAVAELHAATIARGELRRELEQAPDMERLLARVTTGSASPRDLIGLGNALKLLPPLRSRTSRFQCQRMRDLLERMDELADVRGRISRTIAEAPPLSIGDGGVVAAGFDGELDELREIRSNSRGFIARMERREREKTGIDSLKIRFNNVFGFYIEVSKANAAKVPDHYDRKQTLVNAERFTTPELKQWETKVLEAEERILEIERRIFRETCEETAEQAGRIRSTAGAVGQLDLLCGLAQVAAEHDYVRPRFSASGEIQIAAGRHPVVERLAAEESGEPFIPNDVFLNDTDRTLALITGPNMGGKSTYLRQTALTAVMAQLGSFVPARKALLPVIDRIFTRIGAGDNLASGRSTFMVEMIETSQILNTATPNSLILLDEIGRGTSTYDGLAIAWAVVEHIHSQVGAKTLFATHYHELTDLAESLDGVFNLRVSVRQSGEKLLFLRRVEPGNADRSYGIEVARLAGLPAAVIARANEVLGLHERREIAFSDELSPPPQSGSRQQSIFDSSLQGVGEELKNLNIDDLRPIEALTLLNDWKQRLKD